MNAPIRGLVVSAPVSIEGSSIHIKDSNLDPQELRFSLLFWDKLVWPVSKMFMFGGSPDTSFLISSGIINRPVYDIRLFDGAKVIVATQIQAFMDLEREEPGMWSLAQGENSLLVSGGLLQEGKGISIELHRAIPVPDKEVPLSDILEFRQKRLSELYALRTELDNFVHAVSSAANPQDELKKHVSRVDAACADAIRVSKEWRFPIRLANVKTCLDARPFVPLAAGVLGWAYGQDYWMPLASALVSGAVTSLKVTGDFGIQSIRPRQGPYRYVSQFHQEVF